MLAIKYRNVDLVLPTRELIKEIQQTHPWFSGVHITLKHGASIDTEGVFLATGTQLDAIKAAEDASGYPGWQSTLWLRDDSHTDFTGGTPPDDAGGDIRIFWIMLDRVELALAAPVAGESIWFLHLSTRETSDERNAVPPIPAGSSNREYNRSYPYLDEVILGLNLEPYEDIFLILSADAANQCVWEAYSPSAYPWNVCVPRGSARLFLDRYAADLSVIITMDRLFGGTAGGDGYFVMEPGTDLNGADTFESYVDYYNSNHRLMQGMYSSGSFRGVPTSIRANFRWNIPGREAGANQPYWYYYNALTSVTGRPANYCADDCYDAWLPHLAYSDWINAKPPGDPTNKTPLQTYLNEFANAFYQRFNLDCYDMLFSGWLFFRTSTKWEELTYRMDAKGATTHVKYDQFLPIFRENEVPAHNTKGRVLSRFHERGWIDVDNPVVHLKAIAKWEIGYGHGDYAPWGGWVDCNPCDSIFGWNILAGQTWRVFLPAGNSFQDPNIQLGSSFAATLLEDAGYLVPISAYLDDRIGTVKWSSTIPAANSGWQLADGSNGTKNLAGRFLVGVDGSHAIGAVGGFAGHGGVANDHDDHVHTGDRFALQQGTDASPWLNLDNHEHSNTNNEPPWMGLYPIERIQ